MIICQFVKLEPLLGATKAASSHKCFLPILFHFKENHSIFIKELNSILHVRSKAPVSCKSELIIAFCLRGDQ